MHGAGMDHATELAHLLASKHSSTAWHFLRMAQRLSRAWFNPGKVVYAASDMLILGL